MSGSVGSDEWLAALANATGSLPERPGASAVMGFQVSGLAEPVSFTVELVDGAVDAVRSGEGDDVDFTFLVSAALLDEVLRGDLELEVGFMRGDIKVRGDVGRMLSVLPVTTSESWRAALASVAV